ncbi:protein of unknown function [Xenorhabdus poinarii G6]|uniref:Uncharacterized protein n=1 Tax=Xenorhabdus poinarii G6 TaxID=1354304 RepID=A0A068R6E1_9GAMM|nr:protein of unknown function [Xenorhabdus poinarii G6]
MKNQLSVDNFYLSAIPNEKIKNHKIKNIILRNYGVNNLIIKHKEKIYS